MADARPRLGLGMGWRPELALVIERRAKRGGLGFVEVVAENIDPRRVPAALLALRDQWGVQVVVHGVSLSLGGAEKPDPMRLDRLARLATALRSPLISEHIAFVRAGEPEDGVHLGHVLEAGHLMPVERSAEAMEIVAENIRLARRALPTPLAVENISTLVEFDRQPIDEPAFVRGIIEKSGALLLLDVANVYANTRNFNRSAIDELAAMPIDRTAYIHLGGGEDRDDGLYHDTHAHAVPDAVFELASSLARHARERGVPLPGAMIERDERFAGEAETNAELDRLGAILDAAAKP